MSEMHVYRFGPNMTDGKADMKNLLGGKGANLAEMALLKIPVLLAVLLPLKYVLSIMKIIKHIQRNSMVN